MDKPVEMVVKDFDLDDEQKLFETRATTVSSAKSESESPYGHTVSLPLVAGSSKMKMLFGGFAMATFVSLVALFVGVINAAGEEYAVVTSEVLQEFSFPVMFVCLSAQVGQAVNAGSSSIDVQIQDSCVTDDTPFHYIDVDTIEKWIDSNYTSGTCHTPLLFGTNITMYEEGYSEDLEDLQAYFNTDYCFLMNTDKSFKPTRNNNREVILGMEIRPTITDAIVYAIVGVYEHGTALIKNDKLTTDFYRVGIQNTIVSVGVSMDTEIDKTGSFLFSSMAKTQSSENRYKLSYDSFSKTLHGIYTTSDYISVPDAYTSPSTYFSFYVDNWLSTTVTKKSQSFAEVWAALGGALTAAFAIIYFAFKEQPFTRSDGTSGAVWVYRYQTDTAIKQAVANFKNEE